MVGGRRLPELRGKQQRWRQATAGGGGRLQLLTCQKPDAHPARTAAGEIYNHLELKAQIKKAHPNKKFRTESDCEVGAARRAREGMAEGRSGGSALAPLAPSQKATSHPSQPHPRQVISHLYEDHKEKVASMLDGMFSFVLLDQNANSFMVAR
jgi:hypothetical protein